MNIQSNKKRRTPLSCPEECHHLTISPSSCPSFPFSLIVSHLISGEKIRTMSHLVFFPFQRGTGDSGHLSNQNNRFNSVLGVIGLGWLRVFGVFGPLRYYFWLGIFFGVPLFIAPLLKLNTFIENVALFGRIGIKFSI